MAQRRITAELSKHETALLVISRRVERENARHIESLNELEEERATYIAGIDPDTRRKLEAMGVIGGE